MTLSLSTVGLVLMIVGIFVRYASTRKGIGIAIAVIGILLLLIAMLMMLLHK